MKDEVAASTKNTALKFVLLIGVVSFFADFTYEGSRSITGPFLAMLGANGTIVGIVAGLGELLGYGLRLVSGKLSEKTQKFWPITLFGYLIQMAAVPSLALAGNWQTAALLIITERIGKAIRNPPRDVMLSHAAREMGYGWGFGVHEALDQSGALFGPLVVASVLAHQGSYRMGFAVLVVPALITYSMLVVARLLYPKPEDLEPNIPDVHTKGLPRIFWIYLAGAALVAAGFADFQLIAYHFAKADAVKDTWIPIMYSIAMAVSGAGSLAFGRMFDRAGIRILIPLTLISTAFAPLVFLGDFWPAIVGSALWGLGMGVHESIVPAAVATMVPAQRRPSAYGLFTAGYGVAWFIGSAIMGALYDFSLTAVVIFCVALQLAAVPVFMKVTTLARPQSRVQPI
ncbi:MAG TPA: MFS transporter [Candidatus Acidoferrales bacterium]|nr:MFS transporter [Candidatus Acidoferrales bacterium]